MVVMFISGLVLGAGIGISIMCIINVARSEEDDKD